MREMSNGSQDDFSASQNRTRLFYKANVPVNEMQLLVSPTDKSGGMFVRIPPRFLQTNV